MNAKQKESPSADPAAGNYLVQDENLRHRASRTMSSQHDINAPLSLEESQHLVHELRVHQIELDMQNDELRRTQTKLETARKSYFDLYELGRQ